jgi:plastocyanin
MRRSVVRFAIACALLASVPSALGAVPASAGGGFCHGPLTDAATTRALMDNYCFAPTIVRIGVGQSVTWTNKDATAHVVAGANSSWGSYDEILSGAKTTIIFDKAGVYPYYCMLHPGMIGAVVVGDGGTPSATSGTSAFAFPVAGSPDPATAAAPAATAPSRSNSATSDVAWKIATFIALALLVLGAAAILGRRWPARPVTTKAPQA